MTHDRTTQNCSGKRVVTEAVGSRDIILAIRRPENVPGHRRRHNKEQSRRGPAYRPR